MIVWRNNARMPIASGRSPLREMMRHAAVAFCCIVTATCTSVAETQWGASPPGRSNVPIVAGALSPGQDVVAARKIGYDIALVGSALMRSGNPGALLSDMLAAGRAA